MLPPALSADRSAALLRRSLQRPLRASRAAACALAIWLRYGRLRSGPQPRALEAAHRRSAEQLCATSLALRGLWIKTCQWISTRSDLFPPAYVQRLSRAQDRVPPRPLREIRAVLEAEL